MIFFQTWVEVLFEALMVYLSCLLVTAWCTLLERKLLAGAQRRKGPNKVSWKGALQPVADAVKLFTKEQVVPIKANMYPFKVMPTLSLIITFATWHLWPVPCSAHLYHYSVVLFLCLTSCHVYTVVLGGWAANSVYSLMGSLRGVALVISYELPLVIFFLSLCVQQATWDMSLMMEYYLVPFVLLNILVFPAYITCSVAEMHRAPFDLVEAESELVSGYNTDYGATGFILFFISEYANLLISCQVLGIIWFWPFNWVWGVFVGIFISGVVLLARAVYPRVKWDSFMEVCWKSYLPLSLVHFLVSFVLCVLV